MTGRLRVYMYIEIQVVISTFLADKKASYMENGENCDGIGGRQDGSKVEDVEEPEGNGYELSEAVHDPSDDEGGDDGPHESEGKDGPDVVEKLVCTDFFYRFVNKRRRLGCVNSLPRPEAAGTWDLGFTIQES